MKIKFKKFEPTNTFIKLFGLKTDKPESSAPGANEDADIYEYYYKRGNMYYFRSSAGNKITVQYETLQINLVRGNTYKIDTLNNING